MTHEGKRFSEPDAPSASQPTGGRAGDPRVEVQSPQIEQVRDALRSLTRMVGDELHGAEIRKKPVRTVVDSADAGPHVALDINRLALDDLERSLSVQLLELPEYQAVAQAFEAAAELQDGIIIDAGRISASARAHQLDAWGRDEFPLAVLSRRRAARLGRSKVR